MSFSPKDIQVSVVWSSAARIACPELNRRAFNNFARHAVREAVATIVAAPTSSTRYRATAKYEVALSLVNDAEIHELNAQYRHKKNRPMCCLSRKTKAKVFLLKAKKTARQF